MSRKRHVTTPEAVLQRVIADLESDQPSRHRGAVLALLADGPLRCPDTLRTEVETPATELWDVGAVPAALILRAELLAFLRSIVRLDGTGDVGYGIWLTGRIKLVASAAGHRLTCGAEGEMRSVVLLQLLLLLHAVGLPNVRRCAAADCPGGPRLFVKTYRREFCSVRCQKRTFARRKRREAEQERAGRHAHYRRRRQGAVAHG